jgi:hypothetical protein
MNRFRMAIISTISSTAGCTTRTATTATITGRCSWPEGRRFFAVSNEVDSVSREEGAS